MCQAGEVVPDEAARGGKRVRFWCDWLAYGEARRGGHPAFEDTRWQPWEIQGLMRMIASELSGNPYASEMALNGGPRRRFGQADG